MSQKKEISALRAVAVTPAVHCSTSASPAEEVRGHPSGAGDRKDYPAVEGERPEQ